MKDVTLSEGEVPPWMEQVGWTWDSRDGSGVWHVWPLLDGDYPGAEPCYRLVSPTTSA